MRATNKGNVRIRCRFVLTTDGEFCQPASAKVHRV